MIGQPYPPPDSLKEIVFIRHAESQANVDGVWNGKSDGPLSEEGETSLEVLGRRLSRWNFNAVISSPLSRAKLTAEAFSNDVRVDESFIEIDLGKWEGLHFTEVQEKHGDQLQAAFADRTLPMGETGESLEQATQRALEAVDDLLDEMAPDSRVAVVTHGGFMQSVLGRHLPGSTQRPHAFTSNTALTRVVWQYGRTRLAAFNDTGHFGPRPRAISEHLEKGEPVLALIRHGRTRANVERRWQGRGDWDLDDVGVAQADALGRWYGKHGTVYNSPLKRAASTAHRVALNGSTPLDGLMELHMGEWEGLTTDEIFERWPEDVERIYRHGIDLPRGGTGESWADLRLRVTETVAGLQVDETAPTLVVAHGGAIRSYISGLTASTDTHAQSLHTPTNTSVTHVAITATGPLILDYGVAAHLEETG